MSFRALAALALLVLAIGAERCGYYGVRSFLMIDFTQRAAMPRDQAMFVYRAFTMVAYAAPFAGGGLAFAIGPRATAIVGAGIAALGAFALAAGAPVAATSFLVAIGAGMFKPCPFAAAAQILVDEDGAAQGFLPSARRFAAYATFAVLAYAAINLGAMIAPSITGVLRDTRDGSGAASYAFAGAMDVLAAIGAAGASFLGTAAAKTIAQQAHAPYRGGDPGSPAAPAMPMPVPARPPEAVYGPLTMLGVLFVCMHVAMDRAMPNLSELGVTKSAWLFSINPVVVLLMTVPCGALFLVLAVQRSSFPLTRVLGIGLLVFGLGGTFAVLALLTRGSLPFWALALGIMAVGEALAFPLGFTYAALAVRGRAATMVVAGWASLTAVPTLLLGMSSAADRLAEAPALIAGLAVLATIVGGVLVVVYAARLHRDLGGHSNATS